MHNPAFGEEDESSEGSAGTEMPTTDSDPTDSDPTDPDPTDPDPTDPDPTDPTETDPTETDPTDPTDPPPECFVSDRNPLLPTVGSLEGLGSCPEMGMAMYIKVYGTAGGNWIALLCSEMCAGCDEGVEFPVGAPGLHIDGLIPMAPPDPNNDLVNCYYVETKDRLEQNADACIYASMSIFDPAGNGGGDALAPVFVAIRDGHSFTNAAAVVLGDWVPDIFEDEYCSCELAAEEYCCEAFDGVKTFGYFSGDSPDIYPGGAGPVVIESNLGSIPYVFHAQQAQEGVDCDGPAAFSWALAREG